MRRLAWFAIICVVILVALLLAALISPQVKDGLYDVGVNWIGANIVNGLTGLLTGVMSWGSQGLATALAVIVGSWIVGGVSWILFKHFLWDKLPAKLTHRVSQPTVTYQTAPSYAGPTVVPTQPVQAQPTVVTKTVEKEESA